MMAVVQHRSLPLFLAIAALSLAIGCAEASRSVDGPEDGDGSGDVGGDIGNDAGDIQDTSPDATDTADVPDGDIEVCVHNEGGPQGDCADDGILFYGPVASGATEVRLFSVTNNTADTVSIVDAMLDVSAPEFTIATLRYEQDPGDPNSLIAVDQNLPVDRAPGQTLYFEVTLQAGSMSGPLPASEIRVSVLPNTQMTQLLVVPMDGELTGCAAGLGDCDGDPSNGCEADVLSGLSDCGGCGRLCDYANAGETCVDGTCTLGMCDAGFDDCNLDSTDGCETDLAVDMQHCGMCNAACALDNSTESCVGGMCQLGVCDPGFSDCDLTASTGCEEDTRISLPNCGGCGMLCDQPNATETCNGGNCLLGMCDTGWDDCDSTQAGCETNISNSLTNCGACNVACTRTNASPTCFLGQCSIEMCDPGYDNCNMVDSDGCEAELATSNAHCGGCNNACSIANANAQCASGTCGFQGCIANYGDCNNNLPLDGCETNTLSNNTHCGACNNSCDIPNAQTNCSNGTCQFVMCNTNFHDINNDLSDGCEYSCTFSSATDIPDDGFVDANCDGIDGTVTRAVFVKFGASNSAPGNIDSPVGSINTAIFVAASTGRDHIYVSNGTYTGRVTLANGISIYGAYSADAMSSQWPIGWARSNSYASIISNSAISSGRIIALQGTSITSPTTVDHMTIRTTGTSSVGVSNYGVHCRTCTALTIRESDIQAGSAGPGSPGTSASSTPAASGNNGNNGNNGTCDQQHGTGGTGGTSSCRDGGDGGRGGTEGANNGVGGEPGEFGTPGGSAGQGGRKGECGFACLSTCNEVTNGGPGGDGADGSNGNNGSRGSGGSTATNYWISDAGNNGTVGSPGNGGGGGGGGGGQGGTCLNNGGGNGGGGGAGSGCGGARGTGGGGGGGSFGIFLRSSTGVVLSGNTIASGNGGNGGAGGSGQPGGSGGTGGTGASNCTSEIGAGGDGGDGGDGGNGGHGGGGAGGPTYAVYRSSTGVNTGSNTMSFGTPGSGGASAGNAGQGGASGTVN